MSSQPNEHTTETILQVGVEGESATLLERRLGPEQWEYSLHTDGIWYGDRAIGVQAPEDRGPVASWEDAIALLSTTYERWISLYPVRIHPEFRDRVKAEVERQVAQLEPYQQQEWKSRAARNWSFAWSEPVPVVKPPVEVLRVDDISKWDRCKVEYRRWASAHGDEGRQITLSVYNGSKFELKQTVWKKSDVRSDTGADEARATQVLDILKSRQWEIVDKQEDSSGNEMGWGTSQSYTLRRTGSSDTP